MLGRRVSRITALDPSEESSHALIEENPWGQGWGPGSAAFVDSYKSSILYGGESAWGDDNFLLVETGHAWGEEFREVTATNHGYAYTWFIETIRNGGGELGLGYEWGAGSWSQACGEIQDLDSTAGPWKGLIRGATNGEHVIECFSEGIDAYFDAPWLYPGAWNGGFDDSQAINSMLTELAGAVEMHVPNGTMEATADEGGPNLAAGGGCTLTYTIENLADNHSISRAHRYHAQMGYNVFMFIPGPGPIQDTIWLSENEDLDPAEDLLLEAIWHQGEDEFLGLDGERTAYFSVDFNLPDTEAILARWNDDELRDQYYIFVDVGATSTQPYTGELYPEDNVACIPIKIEGEDVSADAGTYLPYTDDDGDGWVRVRLNGSGSTPADLIDEYDWNTGESGVRVWHNFSVGRHTVTLTVTDTETGESDTDETVIIVRPKSEDGDEEDDGDTDILTSYTPEDKFGPAGYDAPATPQGAEVRYIQAGKTMDYRIEFWNKEDAAVPTQDAIIVDVLDPNVFDLGTLEFTRIGFLGWDVALTGGQTIDMRIDCRPEMNIAVEVKAGLGMEVPGFAHNADITENTLVWWFHCIDPLTGDYPEDPMAGFLPPFNPETGFEIGWVEFTVDPVGGLATGTELANLAYVEFDFVGDLYDHPAPKADPDVEPAEPAPWINTIDADAPGSSVATLPSTQYYNLFMVNWSGTDAGSGVAAYDVYAREDSGPWKLWLNDTSETVGWYTGRSGHSYAFYSVASDHVGNVEDAPVGLIPDAVTTIAGAVELDLREDVAGVEGDTYSLVAAATNMVPGSTATVDYGDGTGQKPLTLGGDGSFSLSRTYADDGVFAVTVSVSDPYGTTVSDQLVVTVTNADPLVDAGADQAVDEGETLTFTGSFTDAGALDTHQFLWDFGDGTTSSDLAPSHLYAHDGVYTATLTVTDDDGGVGVDTVGITIMGPPPAVDNLMINSGAVQRSRINTLLLVFGEAVQVTAGALVFHNDTTGTDVDVSAVGLSGGGTDALTCNLSGVTLPDGYYTGTLSAANIQDLGGTPMAGDYTFQFHVLKGDATGDAAVNIFDLLKVHQNYLKPAGDPTRDDNADVTGDGNVNIFDLLLVNQNYLRELPPVAGGASATYMAAKMVSQEELDADAPLTAIETTASAQPMLADTGLPSSIPELAVRKAEDAPLATPATVGASLAVASSSSVAGRGAKKTTGVPIRSLRTTVAGTLKFADRTEAAIPRARNEEPATGNGLSLEEDLLDVLAVLAL